MGVGGKLHVVHREADGQVAVIRQGVQAGLALVVVALAVRVRDEPHWFGDFRSSGDRLLEGGRDAVARGRGEGQLGVDAVRSEAALVLHAADALHPHRAICLCRNGFAHGGEGLGDYLILRVDHKGLVHYQHLCGYLVCLQVEGEFLHGADRQRVAARVLDGDAHSVVQVEQVVLTNLLGHDEEIVLVDDFRRVRRGRGDNGGSGGRGCRGGRGGPASGGVEVGQRGQLRGRRGRDGGRRRERPRNEDGRQRRGDDRRGGRGCGGDGRTGGEVVNRRLCQEHAVCRAWLGGQRHLIGGLAFRQGLEAAGDDRRVAVHGIAVITGMGDPQGQGHRADDEGGQGGHHGGQAHAAGLGGGALAAEGPQHLLGVAGIPYKPGKVRIERCFQFFMHRSDTILSAAVRASGGRGGGACARWFRGGAAPGRRPRWADSGSSGG